MLVKNEDDLKHYFETPRSIPMIMEEYNLTDREALDKLYKSNTFAKIEDPQTGLYYQGAVYVFDFLKEEFSK